METRGSRFSKPSQLTGNQRWEEGRAECAPSGQSTAPGLASLAALTSCGHRVDIATNVEELGRGDRGTCVPANNCAVPDTPEGQFWDLGSRKDLGLPVELARELSIPQS